MTTQPRLLALGEFDERAKHALQEIAKQYAIVQDDSQPDRLTGLMREHFDAVLVFTPDQQFASGALLETGGILEHVPGGLLLLDSDLNIVWSNQRFLEMADVKRSLNGHNFYEAFGSPEILGPDFCPFTTTLGTGEPARSTLRIGDKTYLEVHVEPLQHGAGEEFELLVVVVRDVSEEVLQRQKLNAIYHAGLELGDLLPQEILEMTVDDRVELLKSKILTYTKDLLEFETVEIRLLDKQTRKLEKLLAVGMEPEAEDRVLFAEPTDNGVTGFVAATGKSYLCEDTGSDPLYLPGAANARSSLTVPLILHDEVLGTFNVESPGAGAFDENDLQFLELFARELAVAINTLELLAVEKMTTASRSTELILKEIATPVDEILNDATRILERYIGHEPNVCDRLKRILQHTRDIRQLVQKVGESITPVGAYSQLPERPQRPLLRGKRVLVGDADDSVRGAAHELLERFGCEVETAHNGDEALLMARTHHYDVVLIDIRLPDMNGYECFCQLRKIHEHMSIILMTGFGYDPTHSIVKARQQGLKAVLYKPFRLDQLLNEVEKAATEQTNLAELPKA